jgi:acetylornithine deacetylase/succinyl-diaminopimelate desuccinylase-like protein
MRLTQQRLLLVGLLMSTLGCKSGANQSHGALDGGAVKARATVADSGAARASAPITDSVGTVSIATTTSSGAGTGGAQDVGGSIAATPNDAGIPKMPVAGDAPTKSADAGIVDAAAPGLDPKISGAVGSVSAMRIATSIETLSAFTTRNTCSDGNASGNAIGAARDWIQGQFQAVPGFTVSIESAPFRGCGGGMVMVQNVVAVKLGAHPERVFIIGGHYDSRSVDGTDPTSRSPGANDSGSQTSALLEIARAIAPLELDATIVIAAFSGEEQGLIGSAQLAKEYATFVAPNASAEAMFNMDIVGGDKTVNTEVTLQQFRLFSSGTPREFNARMGTTDDTSPARGVMRYIGYWGSKYVPSMTMLPILREDRPSRGSDQTSFNDVGIPAVRFIETLESENAGTNASHQHSPNDLPMHVTPAYTARIVQLVVSVAASLAHAPMAPKIESAALEPAGPTLKWSAPASGPAVDHYVIAARPTSENLYHTRVNVPAGTTSKQVTAAELGLSAGSAFFISVASVDAAGHESLFSYPEYRCDSAMCAVQSGSLDTTARN